MTGRKRERITLERLEHKWGRPFRAIYRELRIVRGLDMEAVARECGVSRQTIWKWLREMERENTQTATATTDAA